MPAYISNARIKKMTYNEIGKALTRGELTEKRLRDYYTSARKTALSRNKRTTKTEEFGPIEEQNFLKLRSLPTVSALVHEIADVNRYLNSVTSTIGGLRQRMEKQLETLARHGFDFVNRSNYGDWVRFLQWFQSSEYAAEYDSNDDIVQEAFEAAETASPEEWEKLFKSFNGSGVTGNEDIERR